MKLRLVPVLLTFFITAGLLFGGWFAYQSLAVENPVSRNVSGIAGVEHAAIDSTRSELVVHVTLQDSADLFDVYKQIRETTKSEIGSKKLVITIDNPSSDALERLWRSELFYMAAAMDSRDYGQIPERLAQLAAGHAGLSADSAMDDENVYITIRLDGVSKYIVLPRNSQTMGVWPGEQIQ